MADNNHRGTGLGALASRLGRTVFGALENRGELLSVEWQQEKARLLQLMFMAMGLMFLAVMGVLLFTATIIFLFPEEFRLYVAAVFTLLYLGGAVAAFIRLKALLKMEPFSESLRQLKKDRELLEPFE